MIKKNQKLYVLWFVCIFIFYVMTIQDQSIKSFNVFATVDLFTLLGYRVAVTTVPLCFLHKSIAASVYKNEHCTALKCCWDLGKHPEA